MHLTDKQMSHLNILFLIYIDRVAFLFEILISFMSFLIILASDALRVVHLLCFYRHMDAFSDILHLDLIHKLPKLRTHFILQILSSSSSFEQPTSFTRSFGLVSVG